MQFIPVWSVFWLNHSLDTVCHCFNYEEYPKNRNLFPWLQPHQVHGLVNLKTEIYSLGQTNWNLFMGSDRWAWQRQCTDNVNSSGNETFPTWTPSSANRTPRNPTTWATTNTNPHNWIVANCQLNKATAEDCCQLCWVCGRWSTRSHAMVLLILSASVDKWTSHSGRHRTNVWWPQPLDYAVGKDWSSTIPGAVVMKVFLWVNCLSTQQWEGPVSIRM